ncbi:hypothetical protein [Parachitinimonas caeni]|uniref:Uncharacterized protein n=1 Tax=Parachitinimonas caeni TaxID=3031301 RepID=A0ABT7DRP3_9NEIS|nr:hypothetical protein [Parachitinimonas caeni]MDK2122734.1 hypothetical protein [Parachitinimonas caeni]
MKFHRYHLNPHCTPRDWQAIKLQQAASHGDSIEGQQALVDARRFDLAASEIEKLLGWKQSALKLASLLLPADNQHEWSAQQWFEALFAATVHAQSANDEAHDPLRSEFEKLAASQQLDTTRSRLTPGHYANDATQAAWHIFCQINPTPAPTNLSPALATA